MTCFGYKQTEEHIKRRVESRRKGKGFKPTKETRKKMSEKAKERCKDLEYRKQQSEKRKGKKCSEKAKQNMSIAQKERFKNNKGTFFAKHHTSGTKKRISESVKGFKHTEEAKKVMSEKRKGQKPWNLGIPVSKETGEKISNTLSLKIINGEFKPRMLGYFYSQKNRKKIYYDTLLELRVLQILEKSSFKKFERSPIRIPYIFNERKYNFCPDFFIDDKIILEVKPFWIFKNWYKTKRPEAYQKNLAKFEAAEKFCKENNLEFQVWTEREIIKYESS